MRDLKKMGILAFGVALAAAQPAWAGSEFVPGSDTWEDAYGEKPPGDIAAQSCPALQMQPSGNARSGETIGGAPVPDSTSLPGDATKAESID